MRYFSFLKGKRGELRALSKLIDYENIVPLIDIPTSPDEAKSGWLDKQLEKTNGYIKSYWPQEKLLFIDFYDLNLDSRQKNGDHPLTSLINLLEQGYNLGLVTGLDRDEEYESISSDIVNKYILPLTVRLTFEDILVPRITLLALKTLLDQYQGLSSLNILIDLRIVKAADIVELRDNCLNFCVKLSKELSIDEFILAGSSIPSSIGALIDTGSDGLISRSEYILWKSLREEFEITYGDYTVISPDYSDISLDFMPPITPKIVYTFEDNHYVVRANSVLHNSLGYKQYILIARKVMGHPSYRHLSSSKGEEYISNISASDPYSSIKQKTGGAESWITATVNQHIDYILSI